MSFTEPFANARRDITLQGKAFFKVTKDKRKPFTVFANGFATTALGTEFTVEARLNKNVSVKLFEGKVVITSANQNNTSWKPQYLLPNQEFVYNLLDKKFTISNFGSKELTAAEKNKKQFVGELHHVKELLEFNNEPLKKVLVSLQLNYRVKLLFKDDGIKDMYFTGTFKRDEDIKNILTIICNINGLDFVEKDGGIIEINKSK